MPTVKTKHPVPKKVTANRTSSTESADAMDARGKTIAKVGPTSSLWAADPTAKQLGLEAVASASDVEDKAGKVKQKQSELDSAKTDLALGMGVCTSRFGVYFTYVEDKVANAKEMQDAGVDPLQEHTYALTAPLALTASSDPLLHDISARVKRAPGLSRCEIEVSTDPTMATGVQRFPGDGSRQKMGPFTPGTYYLRARHVRATDRSPFTDIINIVVK